VIGEVKKFQRRYILVIVAVIVLVLFAPIVPVTRTYSIVEPYERHAKYDVISATLERKIDLVRGVYVVSKVAIRNVDKLGGTFTVTHYFHTVDATYEKITRDYIAPGETKTFNAELDIRLGQDVRQGFSVLPPKVIDKRVVTKHETIYKSIIGILLHGYLGKERKY